MLAKLTNSDKGVTRLMVSTMLVACLAVGGLLAWGGGTTNEDNVNVYAGPGDETLIMRGAVLAQGDGTQVNRVTFVVALPEGGEPVNFTAPPENVVTISCDDGQQHVDDLSWAAYQYGPGDNDGMLEPGENFRVEVATPNIGAGTTFTIGVTTPDGRTLEIERTIPDELTPVMNLR